MAIIIPRPQRKPRLGARLDQQHPLSRGLVGCWLFNEGGGAKLWDISGNANHGTLTNMDPSSDWVAAPRGVDLDFDGSNDYIALPKAISFGVATNYTFVFRFRYVGQVTNNSGLYRSNSAFDGRHGMWRDVNFGRMWGRHDGVEIVASTTGPLCPQGEWHSIAVTWDKSEAVLYFDGNRFNGIAATSNQTAFTIEGFARQTTAYMAGQLNYVGIYQRALTASEVRWLYTEPYANVVQPVYRRYFIPSGATFQPTWATHSSHIVGVSNA